MIQRNPATVSETVENPKKDTALRAPNKASGGKQVSDTHFFTLMVGFDRWGFDARQWRPVTRHDYAQMVRRCRRWLLDNRKRTLVRALKGDLTEYYFNLPATATTRNGNRSALLGFYDYLIDSDLRKDNPARALPTYRQPQGLPKPMEEGVVPEMLELAKADGPVYYALTALMVFQGLRAGEARTLEWHHIQDKALYITGKGGKQRMLPLHTEVVGALAQLPRNHPKWVFPSPRGWDQPISHCTLWRHIRDYGKALEVHAHPHRLRHSMATGMLNTGANIRTVQVALGHSSPSTTAIYTLVTDAEVGEAIKRWGDAVREA